VTRPLEGLRVLDLGTRIAAPFCAGLLGEQGAEVIKIEQPGTGDFMREIGPFAQTPTGDPYSLFWAVEGRGRKSVTLDLRTADGQEVLRKLAATSDVLVENFRPGTMEKLGYGWEGLHPRFPRLVYAAVSGFGHTGPLAKRPAYDMVVQAMGGVMSITGQPDGPPTRVGTSIGDVTAGLFTAIGICSALFERERTGEAAKIDVAMLDCQVAILENAIARYAATGEVPGPIGARHPSITPFAAFEARDGWFVIAAGNDMLFRRLCAVID
jgi:CoA:oxalate CoA-transferase